MDRNKSTLKTAVPQEWIEQLETLAKQNKCSVSELLRDAIAQYLNISERPDLQSLDEFRSELNTFKLYLSQLTEKVNSYSSHSQLLTTLSIRLAALEGAIAPKDFAIDNASTSSNLFDDDDDCDEPDEILTDFIPR